MKANTAVFVNDLFKYHHRPNPHANLWLRRFPRTVGRQLNGFDCGVFAVKNIEASVRTTSACFPFLVCSVSLHDVCHNALMIILIAARYEAGQRTLFSNDICPLTDFTSFIGCVQSLLPVIMLSYISMLALCKPVRH